MRISDWSSDVCSSDLLYRGERPGIRCLPLRNAHALAGAALLQHRLQRLHRAEVPAQFSIDLVPHGELDRPDDGRRRHITKSHIPQSQDSDTYGNTAAQPALRGIPPSRTPGI